MRFNMADGKVVDASGKKAKRSTLLPCPHARRHGRTPFDAVLVELKGKK